MATSARTRPDQILIDAALRRDLNDFEQFCVGYSVPAERWVQRDIEEHLKRGVLLHGQPGTGKTLTAMYLAAQMRDRTVILMAGQTFLMGGAASGVRAGPYELFDLYGRGLTLDVDSWDRLVQRADGASAAFIRELMRRAALLALDEQVPQPAMSEPELAVSERHIAAALDDVICDGGALTRSLGAKLTLDKPGE